MFKFKGNNLAEVQKEFEEAIAKYSLMKSASDYDCAAAYSNTLDMFLNTLEAQGLDGVSCTMMDKDWWEESEKNDTVSDDWARYVQNSWQGILADMALTIIELGVRQRRKPKLHEFKEGITIKEVLLEMKGALSETLKKRGNVVKGDSFDILCSGIEKLYELDGNPEMLYLFMSYEMDVTLQKAIPSMRRDSYKLTVEGEQPVYLWISVVTEISNRDFALEVQQKDMSRQAICNRIQDEIGEKVRAVLNFKFMTKDEYSLWTKADMKVSK